ncbi:MAG: HEAT repeat domain-containing protein [Deltaproteobacteria bacterium]|nr:HEAT repeat domain-containing protein [Deltaproteobacteria bacterium]
MLAPPPLPRNLEASFRDLGSEKADVRASAIEDVVRHARGDDAVRARALSALKPKLEDASPRVRAAAAIAMGDLDATEHVAALLLTVDDDDPHVRQMAMNALGEIEDARALPRLRRALSDSRPEMRYQAVIAFARVAGADPKAAEEVGQALLDATNDDDDAVVHIALRVAEERLDAGTAPEPRLVTRGRALLDSASPHLALVAAIFLAKAGDAAGHDLLLRVVRGEKVGGHAPDKEDERAAVELVGELGLTAAKPHLEKRVWGVMRFVKDTCAFHARIALARMGHPRAVAEILAEIESPKTDERSAAVVAAGRARIAAARPLVERLTKASVDPELVREALEKLGAG